MYGQDKTKLISGIKPNNKNFETRWRLSSLQQTNQSINEHRTHRYNILSQQYRRANLLSRKRRMFTLRMTWYCKLDWFASQILACQSFCMQKYR